MSRNDLIEARRNIAKANDTLNDLRLDYIGERFKLDVVLDALDNEIEKSEGCCLCGDDNYVADMERYEADNGEIFVCQECLMKGVGVCDCGFPVPYGTDVCGYCGLSNEELE